MCSGSESDLTSVEHNLPLFMMNCNASNDTNTTTITAVSSF